MPLKTLLFLIFRKKSTNAFIIAPNNKDKYFFYNP
jgi:hypothetical protein